MPEAHGTGEEILIKKLWHDESGFIISAELVLILVLLVIGLTVALTALRDALIGELAGTANSLSRLDQSYRIPAVVGRNGSMTAGSLFTDVLPPPIGQVQAVEVPPQWQGERCIQVGGIALP
jgi:hypothetical protein